MRREIQVLRQTDHPNIVKLIEVHETFNTIYLIFELIEGSPIIDLNNILILGIQKRLQIIRQLAIVLNYLHKDQNVIHRDIKPDNILLIDQGNTIKVVDFGLAIRDRPLQVASGLMDLDRPLPNRFAKVGTPGFLAPEIINGKKEEGYGYKIDIFSLGIIYFCMITGVHPFDGSNFEEIVSNNQKGRIDFQNREFLMIDSRERILSEGMLKFSPGERYSAQEVIESIDDIEINYNLGSSFLDNQYPIFGQLRDEGEDSEGYSSEDTSTDSFGEENDRKISKENFKEDLIKSKLRMSSKLLRYQTAKNKINALCNGLFPKIYFNLIS